ncbi:hypothetical protein HRR77_007759 [Exophiala dermatitidis]|nr:hypothetical protein HRR77_007759 [Exophiala dermatitidis]KAJ4569985.1 hypothetical protein HRR82_007555 [Exophiala dermatitidis]KAJ4606546.1 hypothetical protein HRR85_007313 [Exophiala dermatitidis]
MASGIVRACTRCHFKKIRCDGTSECQNCTEAGTPCEPYTRLKRIEVYNNTRKRLSWLEDELASVFNVDCRSLKTGTSLGPVLRRANGHIVAAHTTPTQLTRQAQPVQTFAPENHQVGQDDTTLESPLNMDAPETGLLALNATGELRYLGPSSGSFFASYAASLARSCVPAQNNQGGPSSTSDNSNSNERAVNVTNLNQILSPESIRLLTRSFKLWILPLYPLFTHTDLDSLVGRCVNFQTTPRTEDFAQSREIIVFYLVMALGATNVTNTFKESQNAAPPRSPLPSASLLYGTALDLFEHNVQHLRPSMSLIQILLLISIYSSYGPSGLSQWQLAGLAMRMAVELGLHCSHRNWRITEDDIDRRNRVFWTAYVIETTLAYNLGRPPSIVNDHITAKLPICLGEGGLAVHHVRHRMIQNKIISSVYFTNPAQPPDHESRCRIIRDLQAELDDWKTRLGEIYLHEQSSSYPLSYWERLYHGTSFVLHRSSPLCPHPSAESAEQCIRSAGTYIDNLLTVLRTSNVPLTWMLVQGILFAGLTMLVTARTTVSKLVTHVGASFLLVDFANWTRKCSMCMAIMNERWSEDLVSKLDAQFEVLANDTLKTVAASLTTRNTSTATPQMPELRDDSNLVAMGPLSNISQDTVWPDNQESTYMDPFGGLLGFDNGQTFWNIFPSQSGFDFLDALGPEPGHRQDSYIQTSTRSQDWTDIFLGS